MGFSTVGLTGGIASGKSTVARGFEALGVPVVDADLLAREVVEPGTEGLAEIVHVFGTEALHANGTLNRKAIGARVFADPRLRAELNAITHPRIAALAARRIEAHARAGAPYAIYEAALIVESGLHHALDALVVVAANEAAQLARLRARDALGEEEARARIAAQAPLARKLAAADFIIDNNGATGVTLARVSEVHEALLARVGRQP